MPIWGSRDRYRVGLELRWDLSGDDTLFSGDSEGQLLFLFNDSSKVIGSLLFLFLLFCEGDDIWDPRLQRTYSLFLFQVKVKSCPLPQLPRHKELVSELSPIHARLSCENSIAKRHPIYKCSEIQAEAAGDFLSVMKSYLESICSNLRSHTITNVQSNNDKVSLLLKDSFIDSFPSRDRPFIKLLVDTQLFSVLSDSQLSTYEHESF